MVTLERLVKALDGLNVLNETSSELTDESAARKKEKMGLCTTIADSMCTPIIKSAPNFPSLLSFSMSTLLKMCDDQDSNIRMIADESLNRIIKSMMDNNIVKVQVELHKEIKKNGSVRSLRAALWRFAQLADMIRPQKGKPYVQNLVPCIVDISKRREEPVLETLSTALPKIMMALGNFTTDSDIKKLLKSFLINLGSEVPVVRRTAAASILSICLHCRKPIVFISYALNTVTESIIPIHEDQNPAPVLGALNCIRLLLPHLPLVKEDHDQVLKGSFGVKDTVQDTSFGVDRLLQVYELCLHFTHDPDHNMVTSALETLNQLLISAPPSLIEVLMSDEGLTRSHILLSDAELLSHRSASEMSLLMPAAPPDESALIDGPEETVNTTRLIQWIHNTQSSSLETSSLSHQLLPDAETGAVTDVSDNITLFEDVRPLLVNAEPLHRAPSLESDILLGRSNETPSPDSSRPHVLQSWNIGSALNSREKPLIYCCRRLVTGFLLPESASSVRVRISVRTLALQCVSQVFRIFPDVFVYPIENNQESTIDAGFSHVCDIVSFSFHPDQQLRGISRLMIGHLIHSALVQSDSSFNDWCEAIKLKTTAITKIVPLKELISHLVSGLQDETSVCIRHTLGSLSICLNKLLKSHDSHEVLPILYELTQVAKNSYWLVKVKLLELLAELPYIDLHYLTGSAEYQTTILYSVISSLLGNEDSRIRKAASECILKIVPNLYFPIDERKEDLVVTSALRSSRSLLSGLFSGTVGPKSGSYCSIEKTLSRIVHFLTNLLFQTSSKFVLAGCCEALCLLSQNYTTTDYPSSWQCTLSKQKPGYSASLGILSSTVSLLTAAPTALDLDIQNWLFILVGNLFYGTAVCSLENTHLKSAPDTRQPWTNFHDKKLASMNKILLNHTLQILYLYVKVLKDIPIYSSTASPIKQLGRHTSPARTYIEPEEEGDHEEKSDGVSGQAMHLPHYFKLYELLCSAYRNYKMALDNSDKLSVLLRSILGTLSQVLEFTTLVEIGDIAEEILNYLHATISLEPTASVNAVQQLLKSLFGANLIAQWEEENNIPPIEMKRRLSTSDPKQYSGYYGNVIQYFFDQLVDYIGDNNKQLQDHSKGLKNSVRERKVSSILKGLGRNTDRNALASFIRLFEPMVIQALKQYTVTSDVTLQAAVLSLLTQLVQLRVNYCLLDSDQIFIKFVLRQFEFLELGQINNVEMLVAKIFRFLVHLSYEKNHSKPVISVAKVLQLCDGLMASGQNPLTHCVPALLPIVEHVFVATIYVDGKQVEAQREVVIAMLLRIAEHHQVLELLSLILQEGWRWEDKWRRWSRQSADIILPLLAQGKIRLASSSALSTFLQFLNNLAPGTLRPIDPVLKVFFTVQQSEVEGSNIIYNFSAMLVMLVYIICYGKEDGVLSRLEDLNLCIGDEGNDPLNVTANQNDSPQYVLARLLLKILMSVTIQFNKVVFSVNSTNNSEYGDYLEYLLAHFLLSYIYMFRSGNYTQVCSQFTTLIQENNTETVLQLNKIFYSFLTKSPILTLQWCCLLTLVNYEEVGFWKTVMMPKERSSLSKSGDNDSINNNSVCLNTEIVRQGSIILFCEFFKQNSIDTEKLTCFLFDHIKDIVFLSREPHVFNWLTTLNRDPGASDLMRQAISQKCNFNEQPGFVCQLLHCLSQVHPCNSGATLKLIALSLVEYQHLAPARIASSLACRCAEYLLTLKRQDSVKQLSKEDLLLVIQTLTRSSQTARKYSGLVSLLHKLASQNYDVPPVEIDQGRTVNTASIPSIVLDRTWFLTQVKLRCCQPESSTRQCAYLLNQLDYDDILSVLRCQKFNSGILQYCFLLGTELSLQARHKEDGENVENILSPIYTAARQSLFQHIHHLHSLLPRTVQVYCPVGYKATCKEIIYQERINQLFADAEFSSTVFKLVPAMKSYFSSLSQLSTDKNVSDVPKDSWADLTRFLVLCMEAVHWLLNLQSKPSNWPTLVHSALKCADSMFKQDQICAHLSVTDLGSIVTTLVAVLQSCSSNFLPADFSLSTKDFNDGREGEHFIDSHLFQQVAALVSWLEKRNSKLITVPEFLSQNIRCIVMGIGRCPLVNWYCRTPSHAWAHVTFEQGKPPPSLNPQLLQDIDILHQIIFRISIFGWTNRQQFEETWVSLLSIINSNPQPDMEQDEINAVMQANSIAIQAITTLLLQTTLIPKPGNPNTSLGRLLHISRDKKVELFSDRWGKKLENVSRTVSIKLRDCCRNIKTNILVSGIIEPRNLEKFNFCNRYGYGQVSVQFLKTAIIPPEERSSSETCLEFLQQQERLAESGLDIHSCIQFLLDLYSQWTQIENGISLNLLLEIVKSILMLSDLFTERSHFSWMLKTCLDLSKIHSQEDDILQQYLVVAVCKATAVLAVIESDLMDKVIKLLEVSLKSSFLATRVGALHGLLYLFESLSHGNKNLTLIWDSTAAKSTLGDPRTRIYQLGTDYVTRNFDADSITLSNEDQLMTTAVIFNLLEHSLQDLPQDMKSFLMKLIKAASSAHQTHLSIYQMFVQGFNRLVLLNKLPNFRESIVWFSLEQLSQGDPAISLPALQLLISCIYSAEFGRMEEETSEIDPEQLVVTMEKTSALFDRIKKGCPLEVECVCAVLPCLLADFFPASEVLTKVIGEFLSPQQPHPQLLSAVVFQVLSQACREYQLPLLQAWLVMSLSNFTQALPVAVSMWCLTCFFISASTNPWMRAIFPYIQSRIGRCTNEDRKLLCIAASDFYKQLTDEKQRQAFVKTFKEAATSPRSPFADVIASL